MGITWANKPAPNAPKELARVQLTNYRVVKATEGAVGEDVSVPDAAPRWYEFDLTAYIQQERAAGSLVYTHPYFMHSTAWQPRERRNNSAPGKSAN